MSPLHGTVDHRGGAREGFPTAPIIAVREDDPPVVTVIVRTTRVEAVMVEAIEGPRHPSRTVEPGKRAILEHGRASSVLLTSRTTSTGVAPSLTPPCGDP